MNNLQAVILTCKRQDQNRLELCQSLACYNALIHEDTQFVGAAQATQDAIAYAVSYSYGRKDILFCEDDIKAHPCVLLGLNIPFPEGVGVISLCDMREMKEGTQPGLYVRDAMGCEGKGWWGNQALIIKKEVAKALAYENWFSKWVDSLPAVRAHEAMWGPGSGKNCSDIRMSYLVSKMGYKYAVYVPSLFEHIGHKSVCFPREGLGERETRNIKPINIYEHIEKIQENEK